MYLTNWEKYEGYYECFASLRENTTKIFKLRVVSQVDGLLEAVVRDYETGYMMASKQQIKDFHDAKRTTVELAQKLLISESTIACKKDNTVRCPSKLLYDYHCDICGLSTFLRVIS